MENQLLTNNTSSGPIGVIYSGGATILADPLKYGILEPSAIKREAVESATEAASMIVRIDDVIAAE
jgi:chaperonin GroEL (HSP60 family)